MYYPVPSSCSVNLFSTLMPCDASEAERRSPAILREFALNVGENFPVMLFVRRLTLFPYREQQSPWGQFTTL